jgi:succinate dehydrogenase / fumarate reductase cytochrome b subunit
MTSVVQQVWTSVGRKVLMAVTGLGLFMFVGGHLAGNFTLLMGADAFNGYAYFLEHLAHGWFLYAAEAGLILFFLLHAFSGVKVYRQNRRARARGYHVAADAGGASKKTWASRSMILTGPVILVFVVLHVVHFKFGPNVAEGYTTVVNGQPMRDLYQLVIEEFNKAPVTIAYILVMVLLGLHLRHGFWSSLQSLGLTNPRTLPGLVLLSTLLGTVLAFGFIYIPIHVYLFIEPGAAALTAGGVH